MKSYTSLEQSHKLAEILPIESADMYYWLAWSGGVSKEKKNIPKVGTPNKDAIRTYWCPCWSLAALLDVLPNDTDIVKAEADTENEKYMCTAGVKYDIISTFANNSVDACYELILKLKEMNLL